MPRPHSHNDNSPLIDFAKDAALVAAIVALASRRRSRRSSKRTSGAIPRDNWGRKTRPSFLIH